RSGKDGIFMLRKFSWRIGALMVAAAALVALVGASIAPAASHKASAGTLRIWTDGDRKAAITKVANDWAAKSGVGISIVQKDFGDIRSQRGTVKPEDAPDVIIAAHDWTGQLAANGLVIPLVLKASTKKAIPAYALKAFTYGKLYGMPVALENVGLFVNTAI